MIRIPQKDRLFNQTNESDVLGNIWASYNIDLTENDGLLRLGKRVLLNTASTDVAELNSYPVGFKSFNGTIFTAAGSSGTGYVFSNGGSSLLTTTFAKVTGSNTPSNCDSTISDIDVINSTLYVTSASNSVYWTSDGSTWGTAFTVGASDSSNPHMLTGYAGRVYMTKLASSIVSWSTQNGSDAVTSGQYTLQLGNSDANVITFLRASSNRIWIGTVNKQGGKGYVYEWDGSSSNPTKSYRLEAAGALSCVIKNDVPYIFDTNANLLAWNGGTFKKLGGVNQKSRKLLFNPLSSTNQRFIHPNGMTLIDGDINALIDGRLYDNVTLKSIDETIPAGVWEYDDTYGLYHKHSLGLAKSSDTITDYGQIRIFGAGAIAELNLPSTSSSRNGKFMAGASFYTDSSTTKTGIFYDDILDTKQKAGNFITTKIQSMNVTDMWQKVFPVYHKFLSSTDRIVLKYRTAEISSAEFPITWASTTTFTTSSDISAWAIGDEVEIVQGLGSGMCAHIVSMPLAAGTYTVTLDETYTGATSQTAQARFQRWTKLGDDINDQVSQFSERGIGIPSTWIQFKIWMLWTGKDEFNTLVVSNIPQQAL